MKIDIEVQADRLVVKLLKELYVEDASILREKVLSYLNDGHKNIVIDLKDLRYIDSSGLGVLIGIQKKAIERNGKVIIKGINGAVKELFELTRLTKVFEFQD